MHDLRIDLLLRAFDQAFDRSSWHGSNLFASLRGVKPEVAAWRPAPDRGNIWELVLHCAYWKYRIHLLLTSEPPRSFELKGSNFFERPGQEGDDRLWRSDLDLLVAWHRRLRRDIESFDPDKLDDRPGKSRFSHRELINGITAHDLHHGGQIQLLKKLAASKSR